MITTAIIDEGLRLDAERTQGEWFVDCNRPGPGAAVTHTNTIRRLAYPHTNIVGLPSCDGPKKLKERVSNLDFLAHAANHYAAALREVVRLREALNRIHNQLRHDDKLYAESPVVRRVINLIRVVLEENSNG